jgi:signal transduction histidine kinase
MICNLFSEPIYFFFSSEVPPLLYYSHIPSVVIALLVGFFVFLNGRKILLNRLLFGISISFSFWAIINLITWTNIHSDLILFFWSLLGLSSSLAAILSIYFIYVFLERKDVSLKIKGIFSLLLTPIFILSATRYNLGGFNLTECDAFKFENLLFYSYYYSLGVIAMIWIMFLLIRHYRASLVSDFKKQILLIGMGIELFLFMFFILTATANYLTQIEILSDSRLEMYGLFGMTFFISLISYSIVKFKTFNIKLIGAQALMWSLVILIGSQLFFVKVTINYYLTGIALLGVIIAGSMIVRNVKGEIAQKEKVQILAKDLKMLNIALEDSNEKLKSLDAMKSEFVSLATHQIRGPLAAIKGYVSLMEEGDYGEVPQTFREPLDTVFKSTDSLSKMVTDFLDVSRLDLGQMKYEFSDFDFRDLANEVIKELSPGIKAKGLDLKIKITDSSCPIKADRVKLKQVLNNLVDNSTKYTKQGFMEISVENKGGKTLFAVKDSGVGISEKTMAVLFQRFSRAKNANDTNILGTGLGLYVAKKMTEANNGRVWAESEGEGKGAQFYVELPLRS